MADTWPVSNGSVGTKGSADKLSSRLDSKGATPSSTTSESLDAFGGEGATVLQGVGIDETPGANSATATQPVAPNNDKSAKTFSGTKPPEAENFLPARTGIENLLQNIVQITTDSFLQGLPGSLSSIIGSAAQSLLGQLPSVMQNLLSTTSLTNVFGNVVNGISGAIGDALGGLANGLVDAGKALFTDLGGIISDIPGLGPIVQDFSGAVKGLGDTLSTAYKGLDPGLKAIVDGTVAGAGAKLLDKVGLPSIDPSTAALIAGTISFSTNPANNIRAVAGTSRQMDSKIYPTTGNNIFGNLAASADLAAAELDKVLTTTDGTVFSLTNLPVDVQTEVRSVVNGAIGDIIPAGAKLFEGVLFGNERVKLINGKTYVIPR